MKQPNRTKIVATLGPVSTNPKMIRALIEAGTNVFRLNCSHAPHETLTSAVGMIREASKTLGKPVGILADLQGPKIRVGKLTGPVELKHGQRVVLTTKKGFVGEPATGNEVQVIPSGYAGLARDVKAGEAVLLDDGNLELRVEKVSGSDVHCKVVHGGTLKQFKGINLPGSKVSAEVLTKKDRADLAHVLPLGVDFVALSFVRRPDDVRMLVKKIKAAGANAKVISKLERPEAVQGQTLDDIIEASYGVMVARGDMGVEMGPEAVPALQKLIIAKCVANCTPVITATQMLESMIGNPRPTRAEASDVANAIYDRTSAVMLSAETAAGLFPVRAVEIMSRIIERSEADLFSRWEYAPNWRAGNEVSVPRATVHAAAHGALEAGAKLIAVFTESGFTARYISAERLPMPVVGFTPHDYTVQRMSVQFGIIARKVQAAETSYAQTLEGESILLAEGLVKKGDRIVMVFGTSRDPGLTNIVNIRIVGNAY